MPTLNQSAMRLGDLTATRLTVGTETMERHRIQPPTQEALATQADLERLPKDVENLTSEVKALRDQQHSILILGSEVRHWMHKEALRCSGS